MSKKQNELSPRHKLILNTYVKLVRKFDRHPTLAEMKHAGVTRAMIREKFDTLEGAKEAARETFPDDFAKIIDGELFTPKKFAYLKNTVKEYRRFVVTTAVTGCKVNPKFLESLRTYCKKNDALLLILPSSDPASVAVTKFFLDPALSEDHVVYSDLQLNQNLYISSIKLSAKHIDPVTSLTRIGQRNGSFIYASPKQRLKFTSTSNSKLPHAVMTTGAITDPEYDTRRYMSERTAYIAEHDHVLGAIVVELRNKKKFHFRQIQSNKNGEFADVDKLYSGTKVYEMTPEAIILGDLHSGETDDVAKKCFITGTDSVMAVTRPKQVIVHDGFSGLSINHHEERNKILKAQRALKNQLDLGTEIKGFRDDLDLLASAEYIEYVVVVDSNHHDFLRRYLAEGKYIEDAQNHILGLKLAAEMAEGKNPLRAGVEMFGLKHPEKIIWLNRDEDYKIARVELGAHGDKGANGSRGSLRSMENAYGNSVSGHSHTPEILRGAWQVGTLSRLKLDYNEGPSSWMHCSCLLYPNGMKQLINVIDGEWRS